MAWLLLIVAALTQAMPGGEDATPPAPAVTAATQNETAPLEPILMQLQWRHQWQFAGFYAALEQGYYRDAGFDVTLREYAKGIDIIGAVESGEARFGTFYSTVIAERMRGRPIRLLASYFQRSPLVLLVRPEVFSPASLAGARMMAEPQELHSANFRQMFARFQLDPDDINVVPHRFSVEPFVRGEVDAMTAFTTNEPYFLHKRRVPFRIIDPADYGVPLYDLNLFTSEDYARSHPHRVRAFMDASARGWEYALANPARIVELILERYNTQGKTAEHLLFEAHQTHSVILPEIFPLGTIDPNQLRRIQDLFIEAGLASRRLPLDEILFEPVAAELKHPWPGSNPGARLEALIDRIKAQVEPSVQEAAFLKGLGEVVLGVDRDRAPLILVGQNGEISGIDSDTAKVINGVLGTRIRFETGRWSELVDKAKRGEIDGLSSSAAHPERRSHFLFSAPYARMGQTGFVAAGNPQHIQSLADLAGKRVGYAAQNLSQRKRLAQLQGVTAVAFSRDKTALEAVAAGKVDAVITDEAQPYYLPESLQRRLQAAFVLEDGLRLVFSIRKDWPLLVSAIDRVLGVLNAEDRQLIRAPYFAKARSTTAGVPLTLEERLWLDARGRRLRYCFSNVWKPFDYLHDGKHRGVFKDQLDLLAEKLDLVMEPVHTPTWAEALQAARERKCDLLSGAVATPERRTFLNFSEPFIRLTHVLVARSDAPFVAGIEALSGMPIAVPAGAAIVERLRAEHPGLTLVPKTGPAAMEASILDGHSYAAVSILEHAAEMVEESAGRLHIIGKLNTTYPVALASRNDEPLLARVLQKGLDAISPAERDRIRHRRTRFEIHNRPDLTHLWQILAVVGLVITLLAYRQRVLARLNRRLRDAKEAAEAADAAKTQFLANMSHEIRTPLNAVLNLAEFARASNDIPRIKTYLDGISGAGRSLLEVVNEVLDFSRLQSGAATVSRQPFRMREVLARALQIVEPLAADKGLDLRHRLDDRIDGTWIGDAGKLERILVNLLGNAVKFTQHGFVALEAERAGDSDAVVLRVRDSGIGIAEEDLQHLFEAFRQVDNSLTREYSGSGLGLSIVKRLLVLMDGEVRVQSTPGMGSVFTLTLPLTPTSEPEKKDESPERRLATSHPSEQATVAGTATAVANEATAAPHNTQANPPPRHKKDAPLILVVDDDPVAVRLLHRLLEPEHRIVTAASGARALEIARTPGSRPNLILLDLVLPDQDGHAVCKALKQDPATAGIPIIFVSGRCDDEDRRAGLALGAVDYLCKPFDAETVRAIVSVATDI